MRNHDLLLEQAAQQHGAFNRRQSNAYGIHRNTLVTAVRRGDLRQLTTRVFAVGGSPETERQQVMAAVLDSTDGTVVTGATAAAMWGLPGYSVAPVHLLRLRDISAHASELAVATHTTRVLLPHHVTRLDGVPLVTPTRLLFELSWHVHVGKLERTIDTAWSRGFTTGPMMHTMFAELQSRGRPLIATMRSLLDVRGHDYIPPESGLEARFKQILASDGQPALRRQVNTGDATRWLGRVDFRDYTFPYVAQIEGDPFHTALLDQEADRAQTEALLEAGYVVDRIKAHDIWHEAPTVCLTVRRGRAEAKQRSRRVA